MKEKTLTIASVEVPIILICVIAGLAILIYQQKDPEKLGDNNKDFYDEVF